MIQAYKMGPGSLTLGAAGALNVSSQVRAARIKPSEKIESEDAVDVLSGEQLAGDEDSSIEWLLEATLLQDLNDPGVIAWSWEHAGEEHPFALVPNTALGASVAGVIRVVPLELGGDVKSRPETPLSWRIIGTPTPTWA